MKTKFKVGDKISWQEYGGIYYGTIKSVEAGYWVNDVDYLAESAISPDERVAVKCGDFLSKLGANVLGIDGNILWIKYRDGMYGTISKDDAGVL